MRYVSGTKDLGIMYSTLENFKLIGYIDSDNGGIIDDRKRTYGYTFHFGTFVVSWDSKKQPIVTLSLAEVEYVAVTNLGLMKFFLGIELQQFESGIFISQSKYASDVLKTFNMSNCKTSPTPIITGLKLGKDNEGSTVDPMLFKILVGSLMYLTPTRLDIMYGLSLISRFMKSPKDSH